MRTQNEVTKDINDVELELRSLHDAVKDVSKEIDVEATRAKIEELETRKASLNKELAELAKPVEVETRTADAELYQVFKRAYDEQKRISIGTASPNVGSVNQVKQIVEEVADGDNILKTASVFYGRDASTNIPVLMPMDDIADYAEGASSVSNATGASLSITEIQPKAYAAVLPVTAEFALENSTNFMQMMPKIFADAFRRTMHKGMLDGTGASKKMKGIWVSAKSTNATKTAVTSTGAVVKISELAKLALDVIGKSVPYEIVMNSAVYQSLLSDATSSEDVKLYKESLIRDKSIEGVKIRIDNLCPTASDVGDVICVAVPLSRYAIGIAQQLMIEPIKVKGDTNTYFQATMFFGGCQVSDKDLHALTVKTKQTQ